MDRPIYHRQRARPRDARPCARSCTCCAQTYCGNIGVEFMHIQDPGAEGLDPGAHRGQPQPDRASPRSGKRRDPRAADRGRDLRDASSTRKYTGTKRFGLDGGESHDPGAGADPQARRPARHATRVVIGMPHRGRLNVLANFMSKPFAAIFSEFQGNPANPEDVQGSGDVKYHLGTSADREFDGNDRAPVADRQPVAPRGGQPGRARQGARQAVTSSSDREPRTQVHGAAAARRRRLRRPGRGGRDARPVGAQAATAPAARSTSSSTTRSASPPARATRAPSPYCSDVAQDGAGADLPRERRRSRGGACTSRASPSSSASSSRRTSSSTCSATGATATTRATSRPSPSR